jgi:hypothetical protein
VTRYELLDRIGVGGMAEIFRGKAVAAGGFEKPVAIKRILPHLSQDTRFVELLIAEAKVLSLLKHRNIVQIFDVGLGDDGQYFLVMEYVDGKDLGAVQRGIEVRRRRMPFDLALHIGAEICEALEHAHSARAPDGKSMSLVHRDVSPSNVLLSRAGEVKLTDFGIAKRAEQEQTGSGAVRGKFAYISPEQARNEHIDPRSDVFSVGILLWELITNRRLFSGLGDLEALRAVREAQVPRPTEVDARLGNEVDQLVMTALARDPKNRPTAGQFGQKLRALRYSLDVTVGDPATELAKIIDTADEVERASGQMIAQDPAQFRRQSGPFDSIEHTEATVIRIRTADAFSMRDKDGTGVAHARQIIDRFEEEETRLAQLSGDQMKLLRSGRRRDSSELEPMPPPLPGLSPAGRSRRITDEPTVMRAPVPTDEVATFNASGVGELPNQFADAEESTRWVARSRDRRTPLPERTRAPTAPPPLPPRPGPPSRGVPSASAPPPFGPPPGTVHSRSGSPTAPPRLPGMPQPPRPTASASQSLPPQPLPPQPVMPVMQPMPPQPMMQQQPGGYPNWGGPPPRAASPTMKDAYNQPVFPQQRPSAPQVAGFGAKKTVGLKPWMLVVGALVMAGLAFAITRFVLS